VDALSSFAPTERIPPASEPLRPEQSSDFTHVLRSFSYRHRQTETTKRKGFPYFTNEFWTSGQRQANRLHEISYRACFKAQLPAFFIERLTRPGDSVYDPFMGRGTTPLEAALMSRRPVGNDINPLSAMLLRPRLKPPTLEAVAARTVMSDRAQAIAAETGALVYWQNAADSAARIAADAETLDMIGTLLDR